ncbi:MAG: hypothetical protein R2695_11755 [Acidimicrobiales bacterium]
MRELKAGGATILFIDRQADEVLEIADTITVLRQGRTIATVSPDAVTTSDLAELMVGEELRRRMTTDSTVTDVVALVGDGADGRRSRTRPNRRRRRVVRHPRGRDPRRRF